MSMRYVVLFVIAACSTHGYSRVPEAPEAGQLRVVSYNVNFGLAGDPEGVQAVGSLRGDVVFLQETNEQWEAAFVDVLGRVYPHHRFTSPDDMPAGGMGVLARFPIESIDKLPSHGGYFFAWRVVLATNVGRVQVLNVHLRPPMSDGGSWVAGYFTTRENRLEEIEHHLAALDPKLPTLMVGDFNEESDGLALKRLAQLGYGDSIAQFAPEKRTWEWQISSGGTKISFQLDHILHDVNFVPVAAQIVEAGRSDHKPVWTDFERIDP